MIKKVAFIGHPVRDMERAKKFYGEVLGLKMGLDYEGKWCEFDTPDGKSIGLDTLSPEGTTPYLALETDDIEAEVSRLKEAGVPFHGEIMDNEVCKMAFASAPSGHTVMLHQISPDRAN